ncbi:MAG: hypothetical protein KAU41_12955, partial [Deltaproteobacteria bacterium]|nr:hypothetical protein [Deltaproteobacteria bacterium]
RGGDNDNLKVGDLCIFLRSEGTDGRHWPAGYEDYQNFAETLKAVDFYLAFKAWSSGQVSD